VAYKLTMIFQVTTTPQGTAAIPRTAGWTESVYNGVLTAGTRTQFRALMRARADLLPVGAAIIGQRYQVVLPTGGSSTGGERFPGTFFVTTDDSYPIDIPSSALLVKSLTSAANTRNTILRGMPDGISVGGELSANTKFTNALNAYFAELAGWDMLGRDLTADREPIQNIEGTTLSFFDPTILTVPGAVRLSRVKDLAGVLRSATVKVTAALTSSTYTVTGWTYGDGTGGKAYDVTPGLRTITTSSASRIITRKVGRPLFVFRGRRSKRRA